MNAANSAIDLVNIFAITAADAGGWGYGTCIVAACGCDTQIRSSWPGCESDTITSQLILICVPNIPKPRSADEIQAA